MNVVARDELLYAAANSALIFPKKSDVAIIIGNGPSLRRYNVELYKLYKQTNPIVFGVNRVFLTSVKVPIHYYVALDKTTWKRELQQIHRLKSLRYFTVEKYIDSAQVARLKTFRYSPDSWVHFASKWGDPMGHGRTSVFPCMQLACMAGVKQVHVFGVDMCRDNDGISHDGRNLDRDPRSWKWGKQAIIVGINELEKNGIECKIHSDLF